MSQTDISIKVLWADLLLNNKKIVDDVIKEALQMMPDLPAEGDTTKIAMAAKKREGYEEALKNVFAIIPGDRVNPIKSNFIDMSV